MNRCVRSKSDITELLPWQAAAMVLAVTLAGLVHEHPARVRPLVERLQASTGAARPAGSADLLEVVVATKR